MKKYLAILIASLFVAEVGVHGSPPPIEKSIADNDVKAGVDPVVLVIEKVEFDPQLNVAALDAVVPEVQRFTLAHQEEVDPTVNGYKPATEAKARAPDLHQTCLSPRPRERPQV